MNIKEDAKQFAINAHKGQIRKNEPDKPMIMHPISVGMLLEEYGYNDNVVAAGYLHDVVEDTEYTLENIERIFGSTIAELVKGASEPDKSLSWKERKQHTIDETKELSFENKLVVCADKINNLEDLMLKFQKTGIRDFSRFKMGEEEQKWYYTGVYESLTFGQDSELPIFLRLKNVLDIVFYNKRNEQLEDIFSSDPNYYHKLISLHSQKVELQKLKKLCSLPKPFVIEFCGTPRTGKTTILNNLYVFFKKGGFSVNMIEELTTSDHYKKVVLPKIQHMPTDKLNIAIIREAEKQLRHAISKNDDIILIDRSLNDRVIWNYRKFVRNDMTEEQYRQITEQYSTVSKELIDLLVIGYTDAQTAVKRDYINSLALEESRFLNIDNIHEYNKNMELSMNVFKKSVNNIYKLDTTDISPRDSSVLIAENIMHIMREKYIKAFKDSI
ncbi:MAG: HD domain-containing protein [Bacilli bacterium]|nr:HD domain-containing protein [Bacilli bacterium]